MALQALEYQGYKLVQQLQKLVSVTHEYNRFLDQSWLRGHYGSEPQKPETYSFLRDLFI